MHDFEIVATLADIRDTLCRTHQLSGNQEDRAAFEDAIAAVSIAEQRVSQLLTPKTTV
ncbi:MAG: hypothetical protein OEQ47_03595 [Acidimicrobiia bacterium]|nr:hypothetical protein [Acidimicrobiia bacterium]